MKQIKHPLPWTAGKHANKKSWYVYDANRVIVSSFNTEEQAFSCAKLANDLGTRKKQIDGEIVPFIIGFVLSVIGLAIVLLNHT